MKLTFDIPDKYADSIRQVMDEVIEGLREAEWPQDGDTIYYLDGGGNIICTVFNREYRYHNEFLNFGNCFKTREEAEFKREQLKVLRELEELADDDQEWANLIRHYLIYYSHGLDDIAIEYWTGDQYAPNTYYFKSIESAKVAISKIGKERLKKYYFCIPEDKT